MIVYWYYLTNIAFFTVFLFATATKLVNLAEQLGIIQQISKGRRNRKYAYAEYVAILSEGTELN